MTTDALTIVIHLVSALVAGGVIGLERSFHGLPAGFRTHALVCLASSLLMLVTVYQDKWILDLPLETTRTDPTRLAQGIMNGIGFLGAGVIIREGLSGSGLTTAASIWITAAIGILMGVGFYLPAILATVFTLSILSVFRWIESRLPAHYYAQHSVRFERDKVMPKSEFDSFLLGYGFTASNLSYRFSDDELFFEYRMVIRTNNQDNLARLAAALRQLPTVRAFRISPTGD